ncbi:MAG: ShlB/FhaC/HecB family hemolysin secretion/activation protein [Ignavibacteria bacterium]
MYLKNRPPKFIYYILTFNILITFKSEFLAAKEKSIEPADTSKTVQEVKEYAKKDNFFSWLLNLILINNEKNQSRSTLLDADREKIKKFEGKIIRKIHIEVLDVFGTSVTDPKDTVRSWLERTGNYLHTNSKEWIIKNQLIFSEGDRLNPFNIYESERIIRENPYIYDARVIPQIIKNNLDSVDINVYTQDIWSLSGSVAYSSNNNTGGISIKDINFLGYGNEFKGGLKFDPNYSNGWDWFGSYSFNNIERTFLSANIYYESDFNRQQYGLSIGRDFFSPIISWAGGAGQHWLTTRYPEILNSAGTMETVRYTQQDFWLGYAFDLRLTDATKENRNKFNISGRITRNNYTQNPKSDTLNLFQDHTFYLGRIGFLNRTYYQDNYIFGLGRTEDIPLLQMIAFLIGYENGINYKRTYFGLKTGYSFQNDLHGYFLGSFQIGAFRGNKEWLNRTSILELFYFSNLYVSGKWRWRHYLKSSYSYSFDPLMPWDILNINNESGIRGFSDGSLKGAKKLVFNYELNIFVPLKFFEFKLALIAFADFGLISSNNNSLFASKLYQVYGLGFRIRNEHLIFPAFQFMFGFYSHTSKGDKDHFNLFQQSSFYSGFNKFQFSAPSIVAIE